MPDTIDRLTAEIGALRSELAELRRELFNRGVLDEVAPRSRELHLDETLAGMRSQMEADGVPPGKIERKIEIIRDAYDRLSLAIRRREP